MQYICSNQSLDFFRRGLQNYLEFKKLEVEILFFYLLKNFLLTKIFTPFCKFIKFLGV